MIAAAACVLPGTASAEEGPRQKSALTILQINDVYTAAPLDGGKAGGLARVAALKQQLAASGKPVLLLLAGDFISPSVASSVFKGRQMIEALNVAGLDIATLGNHEFDFGPDVLRERMKESRWQWVVSNIIDDATGQPIGDAKTHLVRDFAGLKVGFIGVCLTGEEISRDKRQGITMTDPFEAVRKFIPIVKSEGAQAIVVITHLEFVDDRKMAEMFPEIDVIIGGHEHLPITTFVNQTLISKAGADSRYVARIDLTPIASSPRVERHYELVPIVEGMREDEATLKVAADFEGRLGKELEVVVGSTTTPLDAVSEHVRSGETSAGNLFADAVREALRADVAIINGGSIRSNRLFPPGKLTRRDVLALHPFGGTSVMAQVSGQTLLAALNHGVGRRSEALGRFPQVSGITFKVRSSAPPGSQVHDVRIGGAPLELDRNYKVGMTDYMLKGGDGYSMFIGSTEIVGPEQGDLLVSSLEAMIQARGTVSPTVEGRIEFSEAALASTGKRPVILDTDMSIDGVIGMLYLLKAKELDVRAITTVHGMSAVAVGARNARRVLELTGNGRIPVAAGSAKPLQGQREFPAHLRALADALGGAPLPLPQTAASTLSAPDLIVKELSQEGEPITIVAMGPLTNIAKALTKNPLVAKRIKEVVVMGGAVGVEGNVYKMLVGMKNTDAEWNVYLDPDALQQVLAAKVPVRLIPLDATRSAPVTAAFVDRIKTAPRDETSNFLLALLESVRPQIDDGVFYFWDVVAAVAVGQPQVIGNHEARIEVVTEEGPHYAQTRAVETGGHPVLVGEEIDLTGLENHLLETILK
jgi:5'-nucleotidase